ncbi:hypothetical protein N7523_000527 [Penicillium sp. IBT 18751x]|nr:hypothetical protein N7523_000527 [Penicillium sp. IBT 18751x]
MHFLPLLLAIFVTSSSAAAMKEASCAPFPSSWIEYSSGFQEPPAPLLQDQYTANFIQHKWNQNLSHITAGYITNSPSRGIVLVDEASDSGLASSLFDYANTTQDGLVDNTLSTYSSSNVDVWRGYVNSAFPLFARDFLVTSQAIFGGLVKRRFHEGHVASVSPLAWLLAIPKISKQTRRRAALTKSQWNIMYQGAIPVTVYVNNCNVVVGYDFFATGERTKAITEYFNIKANGSSTV